MPRKPKPFQSINPDISQELASFMEEYFVPNLTGQIRALLAMTASSKRGTVNWLNAVSGVGLLWALASDEDKARILLALRTNPSSSSSVTQPLDLDKGDVFK